MDVSHRTALASALLGHRYFNILSPSFSFMPSYSVTNEMSYRSIATLPCASYLSSAMAHCYFCKSCDSALAPTADLVAVSTDEFSTIAVVELEKFCFSLSTIFFSVFPQFNSLCTYSHKHKLRIANLGAVRFNLVVPHQHHIGVHSTTSYFCSAL